MKKPILHECKCQVQFKIQKNSNMEMHKNLIVTFICFLVGPFHRVCKLLCVKLKNSTRWIYEAFVTRNATTCVVFLVFSFIEFLYIRLEKKL